MKVYTFEELLPLYVKARQKIRNQRNELRSLNKTIKWEQVNRRLTQNEVERFRLLWDDERKRKMPPVSAPRGTLWYSMGGNTTKVQKQSIFLPLLIGLTIGLILGQLFWIAIQ